MKPLRTYLCPSREFRRCHRWPRRVTRNRKRDGLPYLKRYSLKESGYVFRHVSTVPWWRASMRPKKYSVSEAARHSKGWKAREVSRGWQAPAMVRETGTEGGRGDGRE